MFYRLKFEHSLAFIDPVDYAILKRWKNPSPIDEWQTIGLRYRFDSQKPQVMGLHNIMVWHVELVEVLNPLIGTAYQVLPVQIDDDKFFAIHITNTVNCLDPDKSRFKRFKNRNIGVEHYVLRTDKIGTAHLFTIPDDGNSVIFSSEQLKTQFDQYQWSKVSFLPVEVM